ncbi:MAG: Gp15 family bacteriophage protein [bacterium]|nr:Gp15 family bacteriophage protein [bacterium]
MRLVLTEKHPTNSSGESYYDIFDDWELIESSFYKQYGIRLRNSGDDDLSYSEFASLLSGLMNDTPLGTIVGIRSEKDPKVIKDFTDEQKKIRSEWILKRNAKINENPEQYNAYWETMQKAFKEMCS